MAVLGVLSTLGLIVFIIWLIISAIRKRKKKTPLIGLITCFIILCIAAGSTDNSGNSDSQINSETSTSAQPDDPIPAVAATEQPRKTPANKATITLDEFNKIQTGMTYDKVVSIIGGYGVVISESDIGDTETIMYQWDGEGSLGANSNAMFQDGKLISKAQFGLE
jgi:hypothetical protein